MKKEDERWLTFKNSFSFPKYISVLKQTTSPALQWIALNSSPRTLMYVCIPRTTFCPTCTQRHTHTHTYVWWLTRSVHVAWSIWATEAWWPLTGEVWIEWSHGRWSYLCWVLTTVHSGLLVIQSIGSRVQWSYRPSKTPASPLTSSLGNLLKSL